MHYLFVSDLVNGEIVWETESVLCNTSPASGVQTRISNTVMRKSGVQRNMWRCLLLENGMSI